VCSVTVPVIALITKTDALEFQIYSELVEEFKAKGMSPADTEREAASKARARETAKLKDDLDHLNEVRFRPTGIVYLRGKLFFRMTLPKM
jgi:hypothetical protein